MAEVLNERGVPAAQAWTHGQVQRMSLRLRTPEDATSKSLVRSARIASAVVPALAPLKIRARSLAHRLATCVMLQVIFWCNICQNDY